MPTHKLTVELPDFVFQQLVRIAELTQESLESLAARSIASNLLPLVEEVTAAAELEQIQRLSDEQLWQIANSQVSVSQQERHLELLEKNQAGLITAPEKLELQDLRFAADRLMLRKAHAWKVLGQLGRSLPALDELPLQ